MRDTAWIPPRQPDPQRPGPPGPSQGGGLWAGIAIGAAAGAVATFLVTGLLAPGFLHSPTGQSQQPVAGGQAPPPNTAPAPSSAPSSVTSPSASGAADDAPLNAEALAEIDTFLGHVEANREDAARRMACSLGSTQVDVWVVFSAGDTWTYDREDATGSGEDVTVKAVGRQMGGRSAELVTSEIKHGVRCITVAEIR